MTSRLNEPSLSENERKRISQIILDMTKRRAYRRCLATGQCKGIVVGGHVVPRAWLNPESTEGMKPWRSGKG